LVISIEPFVDSVSQDGKQTPNFFKGRDFGMGKFQVKTP
jgi:hypothetical protein